MLVLCYVVLCYVMLCYVMLCYVMLCYVMLWYMICYVMLCYVMLCYVMLCYVMLCYVMLCYVMLRKLPPKPMEVYYLDEWIIITLHVLVSYIQQYCKTSITLLTNQVWKFLIALFKVPNTVGFTVPTSDLLISVFPLILKTFQIQVRPFSLEDSQSEFCSCSEGFRGGAPVGALLLRPHLDSPLY